MLKLSMPVEAGLFEPLVDHPKVLRVVALSGGFSREEACRELARNPGMIASFSRALLADLRHQQSDEEFDAYARHRDRRDLRGVDRLAAASSKVKRIGGRTGLRAGRAWPGERRPVSACRRATATRLAQSHGGAQRFAAAALVDLGREDQRGRPRRSAR